MKGFFDDPVYPIEFPHSILGEMFISFILTTLAG